MKIIRFILALVALYLMLAAFVVALCRLVERLMARDYAILSGLYSGRGSACPDAAKGRIKLYKQVLGPAYFVKDVIKAGAVMDTIGDQIRK